MRQSWPSQPGCLPSREATATTLLTLAVIFIVLRLIVAPIKAISDRLHLLKPTLGERLPAPPGHGGNEIGRLVDDINGLTEDLVAALEEEHSLRLRQAMDERKYRDIFENAESGIFVADGQGTLLSHNRSLARLSGQERLILQPNGGEQPLRQWLMDNGYRILHEEVLRENRFNYEIIVAERSGPARYTPQELYFGPLQLQERSPAFLAKWQRLLQLKQRTLTHFAQARRAVPEDKVQELTQQVGWIVELLVQA